MLELELEMMGRGSWVEEIILLVWEEEEVFQHHLMSKLESNPIPNPAVWIWDPGPKVNLLPPPPIFKITLSHPTPIFSCPHFVHVITYAPAMDCHQPHHLPILVSRRLLQSQKTLMNTPSMSLSYFKTNPYFNFYLFYFSLLSKNFLN